jgi:hypothetical protein
MMASSPFFGTMAIASHRRALGSFWTSMRSRSTQGQTNSDMPRFLRRDTGVHFVTHGQLATQDARKAFSILWLKPQAPQLVEVHCRSSGGKFARLQPATALATIHGQEDVQENRNCP